MVDWNKKLVAFLHDPPDKPLSIPGHIERAKANIKVVLGREATQDEWNGAEIADALTSAADRLNLPPNLRSDFQKSPVITHPLSGGQKLYLDTIQINDIADKISIVIRQLGCNHDNNQLRYLGLWRNLFDALGEKIPEIGTLWQLLPADTRIPDHSLLAHLSITSALSGAGERPALLIFSIGPVQSFIAAARRTQDLWMGSYLLSYLIWAAMLPIIEQYGPDAILFPSLYGQPLVDLWLSTKNLIKRPNSEQLTIANLPNKFTALLPASDAKEAADKAEKSLREKWNEISQSVKKHLESLSPQAKGKDWNEIWNRQINSLPEIYWNIYPWPNSYDKTKEQYETLVGISPLTKEVYNLFAKKSSEGGGQYVPNLGTVYQLLYDLADRGFAARKGIREFSQSDEGGEQCSVMPGYAALHIGDPSRKGVRDFWKNIADKLCEKGNRAAIKPNGAERLSAIGAIKRFASQTYFKDKFNINERFTSIATITVLPFYDSLFQTIRDEPDNNELTQSIKNLVNSLGKANVPNTILYSSLPKFIRNKIDQLGNKGETLKELLEYDGEWLYPETYNQREFEPGINKEEIISAKKKLECVLELTKKIKKPSRYYAILQMDGDYMGKWLSGTHQNQPTFADILHPDIEKQLKSQPSWATLLQNKRLVSPAYHAAISRALSNFSLHCVRRVVEDLHPGVLVYAGGDDVLALLPLEHALPVAHELRALFSGQAILNDKGVENIDFITDGYSGYMLIDNKPVLTMGPAATASTGLAIAHYSTPLSIVLSAARSAEKSAKEDYDRNALTIHLLKRSGGTTQVGAKWYYSKDIPDCIELFEKFRCCLQDDNKFSSRFAHVYFSEAHTLTALPSEALGAELYRLLKRQKSRNVSDEEIASWSEKLTKMACHLNMHYNSTYKHSSIFEEEKVPQPGAVELGKWLLFLNFLNRGGEE